MRKNSIKNTRINSEVQKELSEIFRRQTAAMGNVLVSVSTVRVSPDLSIAKAYLSIFPPERGSEILDNIRKQSKTVRYELAAAVRETLRKWLSELDESALCEDCRRRMVTNPLRVLDSKNPDVQALLNDAPALGDYLDDDSREHFAGLCKLLEAAGIAYTVNQRLVRGLDYYNRTVFEWVTNSLGSQGTVCAGGRYDGLVEQLGGRATPAVGFAMGLERLVLLVQAVNLEFNADPVVDIYLVASGADTQSAAMTLAERLRDENPGVKLMTNHGGGNFKKQFARADKWGARVAVVLGESEVANGTAVVKDLRSGEQTAVAQDSVTAHLRTLLG